MKFWIRSLFSALKPKAKLHFRLFVARQACFADLPLLSPLRRLANAASSGPALQVAPEAGPGTFLPPAARFSRIFTSAQNSTHTSRDPPHRRGRWRWRGR